MELDFSKIKDLKADAKKKDLAKDKKQANSTPTLQKVADRKKAQLEESAKVLKDYQKNKLLAGNLIAEINKGMLEGADIYSLLLKAIEALSLTVNEKTLYSNCVDNLTSIYGVGLHNEAPLKMKLENAQERLERLTEALDRTNDTIEQKRIKNAVEAHRGLIARLKEAIATN